MRSRLRLASMPLKIALRDERRPLDWLRRSVLGKFAQQGASPPT